MKGGKRQQDRTFENNELFGGGLGGIRYLGMEQEGRNGYGEDSLTRSADCSCPRRGGGKGGRMFLKVTGWKGREEGNEKSGVGRRVAKWEAGEVMGGGTRGVGVSELGAGGQG